MTKAKNPIEFQDLKPYEQAVVTGLERIAYALENIEATLVWRYGECPPRKPKPTAEELREDARVEGLVQDTLEGNA